MLNKNQKKFKGEIEKYLKNDQNFFDSKIDRTFQSLKVKTLLCRANIKKKDGDHPAHLLFMLIILPLLKIQTVHSFCKKQWTQWSTSKKDTFYRFKQNTKYRWRIFMAHINHEIFRKVKLAQIPQKDLNFVIDDTILQKVGRKIENVSYIYDHNLGRSVLGFCIVTLGLFTGNAFYPLDFAYSFGQRRNPKSPEERIGDPRTSSGLRSYEAKHFTKLELALKMIESALNSGIIPGYVLFDSWYAWPKFINEIRTLNRNVHVICRLKANNVQYEYKGRKFTLSELYKKIRKNFKKNIRTGLSLKRITVKLPGTNEEVVILFSKGYTEPDMENTKGKKGKEKPAWVAFLCTDTTLHASTIIQKYIQRWPIEVCFKECKQMLALGKDHSNDFNAQVFATTTSFLRYNLLNYLNESENSGTLGELFEYLADDSAVYSYASRLWFFFRGLFYVSISNIFNLFKIEDDFHSYFDILEKALIEFTPIQGCET